MNRENRKGATQCRKGKGEGGGIGQVGNTMRESLTSNLHANCLHSHIFLKCQSAMELKEQECVGKNT